MNLIDQYNDLEHKIKESALFANNYVAEFISDNDIDDDSYRVSWCGVADTDYLDFTIAGDQIILEFDSGDAWPTTWQIPVKWIDMNYKELAEDYLSELKRRREIDKLTSIQQLERQAKELGFVLTKQ